MWKYEFWWPIVLESVRKGGNNIDELWQGKSYGTCSCFRSLTLPPPPRENLSLSLYSPLLSLKFILIKNNKKSSVIKGRLSYGSTCPIRNPSEIKTNQLIKQSISQSLSFFRYIESHECSELVSSTTEGIYFFRCDLDINICTCFIINKT